jgi:hypothetical protein
MTLPVRDTRTFFPQCHNFSYQQHCELLMSSISWHALSTHLVDDALLTLEHHEKTFHHVDVGIVVLQLKIDCKVLIKLYIHIRF